jgi:G:T/U-mismatch repair DNA glycosylase
MEKAISLIEYFKSDEINEKLEKMLEHQEVLSDEQKSRVRKFFKEKVGTIASSISDIVVDGDEDEFSDLMVLIWLEARLEWNRYNSQMQYQTFTQGQADPELMARGASLSEVIDAIERRVNAKDLYWIVKIAVNPIEAVSYRIKQTQKLIEKTSNYGKISQEIINNQLEMLEHLQKSSANKKTIQKFKSNINRTMSTIEDTGFLEISDFADCVESSVVRGMKKSNLQFQVSYQKPKVNIGIPPEIVQAIDQVIGEYVENLVVNSMEEYPEDREGKSPFMNFSWNVEFDNDCFYFKFTDDGLGKSHWELDQNNNYDLDVQTTIENLPGSGSSLKLSFSFFSVHEFVIFELIKSNYKEKYAIPASKVLKLIKDKDIKTEKNFHHVFSDKEGLTVNRLNWPFEFTDEKDSKNVVVFKTDEGQLFALPCHRFIGFFQSKLKRSSKQSLLGKHFYGFVEKDSELVKVLDTNSIAKDFYENDELFKVLLRAS